MQAELTSELALQYICAKLTTSPDRNRLNEDIIEATEYLNRWYKARI
jgi:hypothetical protein